MNNVDKYIRNINAKIIYKNSRLSHYNKVDDVIVIKKGLRCNERRRRIFHELAHWTAHRLRLNRALEKGFEYKTTLLCPREEIIAEVVSYRLSKRFGIHEFSRSNNYLTCCLDELLRHTIEMNQSSTVELVVDEFQKERKRILKSANHQAKHVIKYLDKLAEKSK